MIGLLAATVLVVAAILTATRARRAPRVLAFVGLGLAVFAVGVAIETELRYRDCAAWNARQRAEWDRAHPSARGLLLAPGAIDHRACERWPW